MLRKPRRPVMRPRVRRGPPMPPPRRNAALRMLRRANRLMESGQYAQAYPLLRRLAEGAVRHGMPARAASLYLRAALARLEMGGAQEAVAMARQAMHLLLGIGQAGRVHALLPRIVEALEEKGYHDEAVTLRAELGTETAPPVPRKRGALPARCPSCGGPLRADEVSWIDDNSAECPYCGSAVQAG